MDRRAIRTLRWLYDRGRLGEAERLARRLLDRRPGDAVARHNLAVVLFESGRLQDGLEMMKRMAEADASTPELYASLQAMIADPRWQDHLAGGFSGPFNGQAIRQAIFRAVIARLRPVRIFETGTFTGATTTWMAANSAAHVLSCEHDGNFVRFARRRLGQETRITVVEADSRSFLRAQVPLFRGVVPVFVYLDAHWIPGDLPLLEELRILLDHAGRAVIMIDDFEVPDDPGYACDDYEGHRLTLGYLRPLADRRLHCFFPIDSAGETGHKRGSIVLTAQADLAADLATVPELRPYRFP